MKKPSLFKQQINKFKTQISSKEASFPQTFKIEPEETFLKDKKDQQGIPENPLMEQKVANNFMDNIKKAKVVPEEQMDKISSQNWNKVSSMTQQERQQALQFINTQLPSSFISKISKAKLTASNKKLEENAQSTSNANLQNGQKEKKSQKSSKIQQRSQDNTGQTKQTKKQSQKGQKQQQIEQKQNWAEKIKLNIQTFKLQYTDQTNENLININSLLLMLGSDNNQSQIVGSKLTVEFINQLCQLTTSKTRELILIGYMPLHVGIVIEYIHANVVVFMLKQARKTTFRSIFIELTSKSIESTIKSINFLSKRCKQKLSQDFKSIRDKVKSFDLKQQNIQEMNISLSSLISQLTKDNDRFTDFDWKNAIHHIEFIIQTILLQQFQPNFTNKYSSGITTKVQSCSDLSQLIEISHFLYCLFNELILKKNTEQYINIIKIRQHWIKAIDIVCLKISTKLNNLQIQVIFETCFLARFVGDLTWNDLLNRIRQLVEIKPMLQYCLLFNTLIDLKGSEMQQQNVIGLNSMFQWLSKVNLDPNYLLNTLIELFLQTDQYYRQLNQRILQKLIVVICTNQSIRLNSILNEEKVRTLIKNYNYDSFGNQIFSKLLFLATIRLNQTLQGLILRETILPYLQIFIKVGTQLLQYKHLITKTRTHVQLKEQILEKAKTLDNERDRQNLLYYYLEN